MLKDGDDMDTDIGRAKRSEEKRARSQNNRRKTVFAPYEISRKYFRIRFPYLLETALTPILVRGKEVNAGKTDVLVKNMGPGGMCFISDLKLPVGKEILYQFSNEILEEELKAFCYVVWMKEHEDHDLYEYGAEFNVNEHERSKLLKILMKVQIKINKEDMLFKEGSFVYVYPDEYFKKKQKK